MKSFFISLGSNIHPEVNIPACLKRLGEKFSLKRISSIYETEPVGPSGDQKFWNLVVKIETSIAPEELICQLRGLEEALGRRRDEANKFAPRTIDLDLLPARGWTEQAFVMLPLAEIATSERDPESGKTFGELADELKPAMRYRKISFEPRSV